MILATHILWKLIWNFKICIFVFFYVFSLLYQTCTKQYNYGDLDNQIININTMSSFQSEIILEQGSSTLYDSRACNGCWQWLPTGGTINQLVIDDTLWCYTVLWLVHGCVINKVLCSLNIVLDVRLLHMLFWLFSWFPNGRLFCDHVYPHLAKLLIPLLAK